MERRSAPPARRIDDVLAAALDQSSLPACITDAEIEHPGPRIVYVNDAYCDLMNMDREAILGLTPRMMQGELTDRRELDRLRAAMEAAEAFEGETVNYRNDGRPFIIRWRVDPIRDPAGELTHFAAAQEDVTALRTFEASSRAGRAIESAARTAIELADQPLVALSALADGIHEAAGHVAFGLGSASVTIKHPLGSPVTVGAEPNDFTTYHVDSIRRHVSAEINVAFTEAEAKLVPNRAFEEISGWASSALDLVVAALVDRRMVSELEKQLGNRFDSHIEGFDISYRYEPTFDRMEISGDWLDVINSDAGTTFVIGDVAGHGVEAVVAMTRINSALGTIVPRNGALVEIIAEMNRFCSDNGIFSTMLIARSRDGFLEVGSAGHLPPIVIESGAASVVPLDVGPPIGSIPDAVYPVTQVTVRPGTRIAMITDGLIEARHETIDVRFEALRARLEMSAGDMEQLADHVMAIERDQSLPDDATLMLIEVSRR